MTYPTFVLGYPVDDDPCFWQPGSQKLGDGSSLWSGLETALPTIFATRALGGFFCGNMGAAAPWKNDDGNNSWETISIG